MKQYIVDAFADHVFSGNQAAVCVPERWPDEQLMKDIARENNFSETAFAVNTGNGYQLRWFTPKEEIDLCGHATLAAYVILNFYEKNKEQVTFQTLSGELTVKKNGSRYEMDLPAYALHPVEVTDEMEQALGARPVEAYLDRDLLMILDSEQAVKQLCPDQKKLKQLDGLIQAVSAVSKEYDCVSRVFAPKLGVEEDPVTGSTHCMIVPYWADKLQKDEIEAFQASERTGVLYGKTEGTRIKIGGKAVLFAKADLLI